MTSIGSVAHPNHTLSIIVPDAKPLCLHCFLNTVFLCFWIHYSGAKAFCSMNGSGRRDLVLSIAVSPSTLTSNGRRNSVDISLAHSQPI